MQHISLEVKKMEVDSTRLQKATDVLPKSGHVLDCSGKNGGRGGAAQRDMEEISEMGNHGYWIHLGRMFEFSLFNETEKNHPSVRVKRVGHLRLASTLKHDDNIIKYSQIDLTILSVIYQLISFPMNKARQIMASVDGT